MAKIHGMAYHPLYNLWSSIKTRCYQVNDPRYKYYGGRGIIMFESWKDDPQSFFDYVSTLPGFGINGMTLDRIDNDGNFEPGNLRWASWQQQSNNKRMLRSSNTTGFAFVGPIKRSNQFRVRIKGKHIGTYDSVEDAVKARDEYFAHKI